MYIVKELVKDWSCMGVEGVELDAMGDRCNPICM